jgi:hypothetical protein
MLSENNGPSKPREAYVDRNSSAPGPVADRVTKSSHRSAHNCPFHRASDAARCHLEESAVRAPSLCILASAVIVSILAARTGTAGALLSVSVTVVDSCGFSVAPMVFAPSVPGIGAQSGSTTLKVVCSTGSPFHVTLRGDTAGPPQGERSLTNGSYTLKYTGTSAGAIMMSIEY